MKKYLSIIITLLFCSSINAQTLSINGPSTLTTGNFGNYTASLLPVGDLSGYTLFWSINSAIATIPSQSSGQYCNVISVSPGTLTLSVIAFKDGMSPSYCATKTITIEDFCANKYRIDDVQCTVGTAPNGWKFQLVNSSGVAVNTSGIVWNSPLNSANGHSYFVIDSINLGQLIGHPNSLNQPGQLEGIYSQFSVTCTINGCTYFYEHYADGECNSDTSKTGYFDSFGNQIVTGH